MGYSYIHHKIISMHSLFVIQNWPLSKTSTALYEYNNQNKTVYQDLLFGYFIAIDLLV